eukprot:GHVO01038196.1.p1 GENE.GHVO01038196.1~~GHVO01038196.1.p1  ORF type:complete len:121 (+),score=4.51 GHVO01038196.1:291-653(+)
MTGKYRKVLHPATFKRLLKASCAILKIEIIITHIAGMQGHLWSETVRTREHLDYMIFPRLLALAERAWHRAAWEEIPEGERRDLARDDDWINFSNTLGHRELARLDEMGVHYQVPPPAAT